MIFYNYPASISLPTEIRLYLIPFKYQQRKLIKFPTPLQSYFLYFDSNNLNVLFNMKVRPCLALTVLTLCFATPRAFATDNDETTLKAMEQTWITAIVNTDRVTMDKLLDDSFVETSANGQRRGKSDLLLAPPPPPGSSQVLMDMDVHLNGDTAVVTGTNHFKPGPTVQPVDYSFTDVFVRRVDGWRVVSSQMTRR